MKFIFVLATATFLFSCSKDENQIIPPPAPSHPAMHYTDLQNKEVDYNSGQVIDIDQNGTNDFLFKTTPIGDPIGRVDKLRFSAISSIHASLFVSGENASPVLNKGDVISRQNKLPYEWFIVSEVEMAEKITSFEVPAFWQGGWKDASHQFLAVQVTKDEQQYQGWVELSIDTANDKLILHRSAISKEASKDVKAGF